MSTALSWPKVREDAIRLFREPPQVQTEADIVEVFELHPLMVVRTIEMIGADIAAGKQIRSAWAVLRSRLQGANRDAVSDITVTDASEREAMIRKAKAWIVNAGVYFDRETEVDDFLFGEVGMLRHYHDDLLQKNLLALWREQRPRGEAAEVKTAEWHQICRDAMRLAREARAAALEKARQEYAALRVVDSEVPSPEGVAAPTV